ncbi:MAG: hypothetical protein ACTSXE_04480 [Candidatus Thorarchaeota archaeon]
MDSELADETVFNDYKELEPSSRSMGQYFVIAIHLTAALLISIIQFNAGLSAWFLGFGIVVPILLIVHGFLYSSIPNDSWYRDQMVPFILSIVMTTEIETDRYLQYQRRLTMISLILGWFVILMCQIAWTFSLTAIVPAFTGADILTRLVGELIAYGVIIGPFVLYFLLLFLVHGVLEKLLKSRYNDITHLFEIEMKWSAEKHRRTKEPVSS